MTEKFGISLPDNVVAEIEEPLEYGDTRTERVLDLVRIGLAFERELSNHNITAPTTQEQIDVIRAAMDCYTDSDE